MTGTFERIGAALGDRYRLARELGAGGMATVYLAHDLKHDREVAIKVLREEFSASLGQERFLREIQIAARLQHPHVLPLFDSGEAAGFLYYVMPYVDGPSLRDKLVHEGEFPVADAVRVLRDVADALSEAHRCGVVHRDLKPENVMLRGRHALVTDFGIAKAVSEAAGTTTLTTAGVALGTPAYMAPEQATADPNVDHRADVYAFGVLAYEILTGRPPFTGSTPQQVLAAHVTSTADPVAAHRASVPPALASLVMRCLEKKPADRPQSAAELVSQLEVLLTPSGEVAASAGDTRHSRWRTRVIAASAILLAAIGVVLWARPHPTTVVAPGRIAVLPFENVGGDSTLEYFAEGMTDDVNAALSGFGLPVVARTSAYSFKGQQASPQDAGRALNAGYVVQGSVRRSGNRMHVTAELTSVADGLVLASYSEDREARDVFAVQNAIVQKIVGKVEPSLRIAASRGAPHQTADLEAHDLYWRGRYQYNLMTKEGLENSIRLYEAALARDPAYALAHAGISLSLGMMADAYAPPVDVMPQALREAARAIALDSTLADGWSAAANINVSYTWDFDLARSQFERAQQLNRSDGIAHSSEAAYWMAMRRPDRLVAPARRTVEMDPRSAVWRWFLMSLYLMADQPDSAIAESRIVFSLEPNFVYIDALDGYAYGVKGMTVQAESAFKRVEPLLGNRSPGLAWLYARTGRRAQAIAILNEIEQHWPTRYVLPNFVAGAYAALGDTARMYAWLDKGLAVHSYGTVIAALWPAFRPYWGDPRFKAIMRKANMPEEPPR